jgi:hypothetical protein
MRIATTRFAALFVFTAVVVETNAVAPLTKLNVGYVGITSDNAAAFIARDTVFLATLVKIVPLTIAMLTQGANAFVDGGQRLPCLCHKMQAYMFRF